MGFCDGSDVQLEATISSLELTSPNRLGEILDIITLSFMEMSEPITQEMSISISCGL